MLNVVELDSTCNVECLNTDCENHLESRYIFRCNLKYIMISKEGKCLKYRKIPDEIRKKNDSLSTMTETKIANLKDMADLENNF